jgi:hypothetical protein
MSSFARAATASRGAFGPVRRATIEATLSDRSRLSSWCTTERAASRSVGVSCERASPGTSATSAVSVATNGRIGFSEGGILVGIRLHDDSEHG